MNPDETLASTIFNKMDIILRITNECNQRCKFCNVTYDYESPSISDIKHWINIRRGYENISISGGEPTLRDELPSIIRYAKQSHIKKVTLQTNALRFSYDKYAKIIKLSGLDELFISFHAHSESLYGQITNTTGHFKIAHAGITNALSLKIPVVLNIVINKLNYKSLPEYVKFVNDNFTSIQHISFSFVQPQGRAQNNKYIVPMYSEVEPYLIEALDYCHRVKLKFYNPYCGFPLCMFGKYYQFSNEFMDSLTMPLLKNTDNHASNSTKIKDHLVTTNSIIKNKVKSSQCNKCKMNAKCNGVWVWYKELYGIKELKPIKCATKHQLIMR
ncbi:MAG: radical SAM protein [Candidatus Cloacimonetes bacterium]|nr:radical SAM protein [Candidatus Cloacimonadota bacterium]